MSNPSFRALSLGEERVRLGFNEPHANPAMQRIQRAAADLIDAINEAEGDPRLKALGMTAAEDASMWGVKAVTGPAPGAQP